MHGVLACVGGISPLYPILPLSIRPCTVHYIVLPVDFTKYAKKLRGMHDGRLYEVSPCNCSGYDYPCLGMLVAGHDAAEACKICHDILVTVWPYGIPRSERR